MVGQITHTQCAARRSRAQRGPTQRGLTLIELLVVMLVVAMTAGVVAMNLPPSESEARKEADRFAMRLIVAGEQAIMSGSVIAMDLQAEGYRFYRYDRGGWRDIDLGALSAGQFPADISVDFTVLEPARRNEEEKQQRRSDDDVPAPNVFFSPTGETTALDISFANRRTALTLSLDNAGALEGPRERRR